MQTNCQYEESDICRFWLTDCDLVITTDMTLSITFKKQVQWVLPSQKIVWAQNCPVFAVISALPPLQLVRQKELIWLCGTVELLLDLDGFLLSHPSWYTQFVFKKHQNNNQGLLEV